MKVLVVGAGFAGLAAAFAARRAGASVSVVHGATGASGLYAGALDGEVAGGDAAERALLAELADALGLRLSSTSVVATREGVVRRTHGADAALLDLAPLAGKRIAVVDVPRDDWDAPLLVRAFAESDWARASGSHFQLVSLELLEKGHQRRVSPFDFAASFERAERPGWLLEVLKAHAGPDAWLFGPWLGIKRLLARELTQNLGVPVGEVTSPPGGAAGARFELRRDALLRALEIEVRVGRVIEIRDAAGGAGKQARLEDGALLEADRLVLCAGGFVSGGLELSGSLSGAEPAGFRLGVAGLPPAQLRGDLASPVSSLFGVDLGARGRHLLEHVGLPIAADGAVFGGERIFAAGDLVAPSTPSVGHALVSGLRAGSAAARQR